jgi:septum formation protein
MDRADHAMKTLILASGSPRRRELIKLTGLSFQVARPDIDETPGPTEPPTDYVARLSREKALAAPVNGFGPDTLILTADTTVALDGTIIGKPVDPAEATAILRQIRAKTHYVHTGVSLRDLTTGNINTTVTTSEVVIRDYSDAEIEAYVASGEPFDKAGAYAVQDAKFHPVARLDGCMTNVMGLPMCTICAMLRAQGLPVTRPLTCSPDHLPCEFNPPAE